MFGLWMGDVRFCTTTRYCNILTLFILLKFGWVSSFTSSKRRHEKKYPLTSFHILLLALYIIGIWMGFFLYFFNKEAWEEISFDKFPYFTTRYCNILTLFILLEFRWVSSCTSSTRRHEKQYPLTSFLWQVCLDKFPFTRVYQQVVHPPHALHNGWSACNLFVSHVFNFVYWRDWT